VIAPRRATRRVALLIAGICSACLGREDVAVESPIQVQSSALSLPRSAAELSALLRVHPDSLHDAALRRLDAGAADSAHAIWSVHADLARTTGDTVALARAMMWLGIAEWKLGDFPAARASGESSITLKRHSGLDAELSQSFNALALLAWHQGHYAEALVRLDSALVAAHRNDDPVGIARASLNVPLIQVELGQYDEARRGFHAALAAARGIGNDRYEGNALANLAMLEIRIGDPGAAVPLLAEARRLYARSAGGDLDGEANALGQLATAWSALGDLQRAIAAADSALALAHAQQLPQEVAATLEVLADLHFQAGSPRLALRRLRQADSIDAILGLQIEKGNNRRRSALILLELGDIPASIARAREALAVHQAARAVPEIVQDRLQLALALAGAGELGQAIREVDAAVMEAKSLNSAALSSHAAAVAADLSLRDGRPSVALRHASSVSTPSNGWALAHLKAGALLQLDRLQEATVEARRAVAGLERERSSLGQGPLRSSYFLNRTGPFARLVEILLIAGDTASAFEVAASVPGRALAERLGATSRPAATLAVTAERERVLRRAGDLERELYAMASPDQAGERGFALRRALDATRVAYEEHLAHASMSASDRVLGTAQTRAADVQQYLGAGEALVTFLSGPERLDIFLVTRRGLVHRSTPISDRELAAQVRIARELIGTERPGRGPAHAMSALFDLLLGGLREELTGISHLLVVPHGPLAALPFAALWDAHTRSYLITRAALSYLPSAAAIQVRSDEVTALSGTGMTVFTPQPDLLPGTAVEARSVARLVPGARRLDGRESTEERVREALRRGRSVHIASHGSQNLQNPLFSRIMVGQGRGRGAGPAGDGRLEVHEILELSTRSPLVFLSGCETGLVPAAQGQFARHVEEGALAQAFLAAGVRVVVATLWEVEDAAAAEIATGFYARMRDGSAPAEALASTQRALIQAGRGLGWAAYTVSGVSPRKRAKTVRSTGSTH